MGLTLLGQLSFSTGVWCGSYWLMLLGRFIFGYVYYLPMKYWRLKFFISIGAEPLTVAQYNYAVLWFKGKVLNMMFGLQSSFSGIGSTVNFMAMENLYDKVTEKFVGLDGLAITFYLGECLLIYIPSSLLIKFL